MLFSLVLCKEAESMEGSAGLEALPVGLAQSALSLNVLEVVKCHTILGVGYFPFKFGVDKQLELLVQVKVSPTTFFPTEVHSRLRPDNCLIILGLSHNL